MTTGENEVNPLYADHHLTLYNGDCRSMAELPDESVQCVPTNPPYWGLRKYAGQQDLIWGGSPDCIHEWQNTAPRRARRASDILNLQSKEATNKGNLGIELPSTNTCSLCGAWRGAYGLEPTPELYVRHTVEILREIKRVLRKDGVCFLNLGDSYYASGGGHKPEHANPGLSKSAERGGVPRVWRNGKRDKALLDSQVRDFFSQNPCGEYVKILLSRNPDNYNYHDLTLALSNALSNHSHKELRIDHSNNLDLTYQADHNASGISGLCSFADWLFAVSHTSPVSSTSVLRSEQITIALLP